MLGFVGNEIFKSVLDQLFEVRGVFRKIWNKRVILKLKQMACNPVETKQLDEQWAVKPACILTWPLSLNGHGNEEMI